MTGESNGAKFAEDIRAHSLPSPNTTARKGRQWHENTPHMRERRTTTSNTNSAGRPPLRGSPTSSPGRKSAQKLLPCDGGGCHKYAEGGSDWCRIAIRPTFVPKFVSKEEFNSSSFLPAAVRQSRKQARTIKANVVLYSPKDEVL